MFTLNGIIPPLHEAAAWGKTDEVNRLLDSGVDKDMLDAHGCTALHWAVKSGNYETVHAFIKAGAKLDIRNKKGKTPLENTMTYRKNFGEILHILSEEMEKQGG